MKCLVCGTELLAGKCPKCGDDDVVTMEGTLAQRPRFGRDADDIVVRLRKAAEDLSTRYVYQEPNARLMREAADVIEELRDG